MLHNDPWIGYHRRVLAVLAFVMVLTSVVMLILTGNLFIPVLNVSWDRVSGIFRVGAIFIFLIPGFLLERNLLRYRLQQHQKLVANASDGLVTPQPVSNKYALLPPFTITVCLRRGRIFLLAGIPACIALAFTGLAIWVLVAFFSTPYDAYYTGDEPLLAAISGGIAFACGLLAWIIWLLSRNWVKITEAGLESRFRGHIMKIAWSEARFFSINGVRRSEQQYIYTLSGNRKSVSWIQLTSKSHASLYQPVLPAELYQQQSHALLEVVAGQTHLPLYDMRHDI